MNTDEGFMRKKLIIKMTKGPKPTVRVCRAPPLGLAGWEVAAGPRPDGGKKHGPWSGMEGRGTEWARALAACAGFLGRVGGCSAMVEVRCLEMEGVPVLHGRCMEKDGGSGEGLLFGPPGRGRVGVA